ncbi:MAG: hypothetical protein PUD07_02755 [bacterium]|nr:hypothetical protein [bacterium]
MKKSKYCLFLFIILFIGKNVFAECTYEEQAKLNSEAATIKAIYEEQKGNLDLSNYICADGQEDCNTEYSYFKVAVLNLSENFYVKISEGKKTITTLTYSNVVDGIASFDVEDITETHTYKFDVYTSDKTNCKSKLNRSFYLTTPRLNEYANYSICDELPDYYLCQQYVTFTDMGFSDFVDKIESYKKEEEEKEKERNKSFFEKIGDFVKEHKTIFITGGVVIIVGVAGVIIIKQKRRKDII